MIRDNRRPAGRRPVWGTLLTAVATLGYFASYGYLVWQAVEGRITVGTLTFLAGALGTAQAELSGVFSLVSSISEHALFLTDLLTFLTLEPTIASKPGALPAPRPIRDGLEFRRVSFRYPGSEKLVLKDLDFRIEPGERVAIVGENGGGKTTFVKLVARLSSGTTCRSATTSRPAGWSCAATTRRSGRPRARAAPTTRWPGFPAASSRCWAAASRAASTSPAASGRAWPSPAPTCATPSSSSSTSPRPRSTRSRRPRPSPTSPRSRRGGWRS